MKFNGSSGANGLRFATPCYVPAAAVVERATEMEGEMRKRERRRKTEAEGEVWLRNSSLVRSAQDGCFPSCSSITHPMIHFTDTWVIIGVSSSPPGEREGVLTEYRGSGRNRRNERKARAWMNDSRIRSD